MSNQNQSTVTGRTCTAAANPIFGNANIAAVHVATVHEEFGSFAKFVFTVYDENGTPIYAGNETVNGQEYIDWDGNDLDFPYRLVAGRRGLTLTNQQPQPEEQ